MKLVLIDNASKDGSVEYVSTHYPQCQIIENSTNLGWCEANNKGIQFALKNKADYIVMLNSDIQTKQANWLNNLVLFAEAHEEFGIYGCVQYDYDSDGWETINDWTKYILGNGNRDVHYMWDTTLKMKYPKPAYTKDSLSKHTYLECRFVQGAAMMVKREVFEAIGFFDPIYYIFFDEVDFSRRSRWAGYRTALVCNSKIKHKGGGDTLSTSKKRRTRNFYYSRNKYIFILTDSDRDLRTSINIIREWLAYDWRDAVNNNIDISDITQYFLIVFSVLVKIPHIIIKRKKEKRLANFRMISRP